MPRWGIPGPGPRMTGAGSSLPRAICQTAGPIIDPKTAFDSLGLEPSEYVTKFYLKVTNDVKDRVKGQN